MNREILFRGKRTDNGEWIYGYYFFDNINVFANFNGCHYVHPCGQNQGISVIPETVGQYTGLTDKNGKKIFEGDIIQSKSRGRKEVKVYRFLIKYGSYIPSEYCNEIYSQCETIGFYAFDRNCDYQLSNCPKAIEIIGNIHDNPELLEVHNGTKNTDSLR